MKHVFSIVALVLTLLFMVVFFTGKVHSEYLPAVAARVGLQPGELDAMVPRISSQSGASIVTARRVVYLLACSGMPTSSTMEEQALRAAQITQRQRVSAREAATYVLEGKLGDRAYSPLKDC
jgi:protein-disulfide isomerase-like protein with CxxC motif